LILGIIWTLFVVYLFKETEKFFTRKAIMLWGVLLFVLALLSRLSISAIPLSTLSLFTDVISNKYISASTTNQNISDAERTQRLINMGVNPDKYVYVTASEEIEESLFNRTNKSNILSLSLACFSALLFFISCLLRRENESFKGKTYMLLFGLNGIAIFLFGFNSFSTTAKEPEKANTGGSGLVLRDGNEDITPELPAFLMWPLHGALSIGLNGINNKSNLEDVKRFLTEGFDVNELDNNNETPLDVLGRKISSPSDPFMIAKIIKLLKDNGAINAKVYGAAGLGDYKQVKKLLSNGANVNEQSPKGKNVFSSTEGWPPLHYAVYNSEEIYGDWSLWDVFKREGLDLDIKKTISTLLSDSNLRINWENDGGETALDVAAVKAHNWSDTGEGIPSQIFAPQTIHLLLQKGASYSTIIGAASAGDNSALIKLLKFPKKSTLKKKNNALVYASNYGMSQSIKTLVRYGADVNTDEAIQRPIGWAVVFNHMDAIKTLLDLGAQVNYLNSKGETPLDIAKNNEVANILRKHGGKTGEELKAEGK
jgi:ankyrin repeat protein